jgi:hypothetical protein
VTGPDIYREVIKMRKLMKAIALLMAMAMLAGLTLAEDIPEVPDGDLEMPEDAGDLEIGEGAIPELGTDGAPDGSGVDLDLGNLELASDVTYRFIVSGEDYATQVAQVGEEIRCPEAPEAPKGKSFAGWVLADDTPLFVDGDGDGKIDAVIVQECELGTEVIVRAAFTGEKAAEESATGEEGTEEPAEEPANDGAPVANALVYTGEAQALVSAGEGWLFSTDGQTYAPEIPTAVDAGEYTVYYVPAGADGEVRSLVATVAKADVVLIPPEAADAEA